MNLIPLGPSRLVRQARQEALMSHEGPGVSLLLNSTSELTREIHPDDVGGSRENKASSHRWTLESMPSGFKSPSPDPSGRVSMNVLM